jgi:FkbM family methyltransferase
VLDVGANAGYFSLLAWDLGGPESSIHAFEPNPDLVRLLEASVALGPRITINRAACGLTHGSLPLYLGADPSNTGLASLEARAAKGTKTIVVPVIALDDYCERLGLKPDVVKIDVEGYEASVLAGMSRVLDEFPPSYVVCELVSRPGCPPPEGVIEQMRSKGYEAYRILSTGALTAIGDVQEENVCFVLADKVPVSP